MHNARTAFILTTTWRNGAASEESSGSSDLVRLLMPALAEAVETSSLPQTRFINVVGTTFCHRSPQRTSLERASSWLRFNPAPRSVAGTPADPRPCSSTTDSLTMPRIALGLVLALAAAGAARAGAPGDGSAFTPDGALAAWLQANGAALNYASVTTQDGLRRSVATRDIPEGGLVRSLCAYWGLLLARAAGARPAVGA